MELALAGRECQKTQKAFFKFWKQADACSTICTKPPHFRSNKTKNMKIKPLADRVLVEPVKAEEKTESGIVLPETIDREKPEQGKVVAVGEGRIDKNGAKVPMTVKKGDLVLFTKYGPSAVKVESKEYLIIKEEDILAVLEK